MQEQFYDDEHHAIRSMIESGRGYKACASHLFPDMKPESAYAKLKHAVNGQHGESLRFSQVMELMRFNRKYDPLIYACDETAHERPQPRNDADETAALRRAYIDSVNEQKRIADRMERLIATSPLAQVGERPKAHRGALGALDGGNELARAA